MFFKLLVGPEYLGAIIALREGELPADASSGYKTPSITMTDK